MSAGVCEMAWFAASTCILCRNCWGHSDMSTTMIYPHVLKVATGRTSSPLDALALHLRPS